MSNSIIPEDFPYDIIQRGQQDSSRHSKRVKEAAKKQLKDIISQQDVITGDSSKRVRVRLKNLEQYKFTHNKDHIEEVGRDEFDELSVGEILSKPSQESGQSGKKGNTVGENIYEAEFTLEELTQMMIEDFKLPDLDPKNKNEIVSEVYDWTDRRKGSGIFACIDKKKTILSHILRKSKMKKNKSPLIKDDFQFRTWEVNIEKHSNAVIFLMLDRSGSMAEEKIYHVKALYFWIVRFLRSRYANVHIKFIAHDYEARELNENDFFSISDSGGTRVSSAYTLCKEMIQKNYPSDSWNIYALHSSDGDSWNDEEECVKLVKEIISLGATVFSYCEIQIDKDNVKSDLMIHLERLVESCNKVLVSVIHGSSDVLSTLRRFLQFSSRNKNPKIQK